MKKLFSMLLRATVVILFIIVFVPFASSLVSFLSNGSEGIMMLFEYIVALIAAWYLNIVVHEGGHLVFGLACGYRFSSFRIGSLMLVSQQGKLNFRSYKLAGTGGQCLMIPPERKEKMSEIILFNLGGVIFNFIFSIICFTLKFVFPDVYILSQSLLFSGFLSVFGMLTNGIPLNMGGIANDGMNALQLSQNSEAAASFKKQLLINAAQTEGIRVSEMPDEWFALPEGADMQNTHNATLAVFAAERLFDSGDINAVSAAVSEVLNSDYNIIGLHRNLLTCDLIYCQLVNGSAEVDGLLTPSLYKFMSTMKNYPSIIRTEYTIALLKNGNKTKAEKILAHYEKIAHKFPYQQEIDSERALMTKALEKFENK